MQPTTITTMLLITFAVGLITMTIRLYFGSWEPRAPRRAPSPSLTIPRSKPPCSRCGSRSRITNDTTADPEASPRDWPGAHPAREHESA